MNSIKRCTLPAFLFLAHFASAQNFYPLQEIIPQENIVNIEYLSALPSGQVTIIQKNLCPSGYNGGSLYRVVQFLDILTNAKLQEGHYSRELGNI